MCNCGLGNKLLYQRGKQLGEGAYAQVFSCERQDGGVFAVKVFLAQLDEDDQEEREYTARCMEKEIGFLKSLAHANIVHCEEAVEYRGVQHIVLEKMTCTLLEVERGGHVSGYQDLADVN